MFDIPKITELTEDSFCSDFTRKKEKES